MNTNRDAVGSVKSWCNECGWGNHITENHQIAVAAKERKFSGDFDPSRLVCVACGTVGHSWKVCDQYEQNKLRCSTSLAIKENRRTAKDKRIEQMNAMMKERGLDPEKMGYNRVWGRTLAAATTTTTVTANAPGSTAHATVHTPGARTAQTAAPSPAQPQAAADVNAHLTALSKAVSELAERLRAIEMAESPADGAKGSDAPSTAATALKPTKAPAKQTKKVTKTAPGPKRAPGGPVRAAPGGNPDSVPETQMDVDDDDDPPPLESASDSGDDMQPPRARPPTQPSAPASKTSAPRGDPKAAPATPVRKHKRERTQRTPGIQDTLTPLPRKRHSPGSPIRLEDVTANLFDDSDAASSDSVEAAPSHDDDDEFLQSLRHHERERRREQGEQHPQEDNPLVPETPHEAGASDRGREARRPPPSWQDELQKMRTAMEEKDRQLAKVNQRLNDIQSIDIDQSPQQRQHRQRRRAEPKNASEPAEKQPARQQKGKETVDSSIQQALSGSVRSAKVGEKVYVIHTAANGAYQYQEATVATVDKEHITVAWTSHPSLPLYATGLRWVFRKEPTAVRALTAHNEVDAKDDDDALF